MKTFFRVVLTFTVPQDKIEFIQKILSQNIEPTRKENGCILCELYQDSEQKNMFIIFEMWTDNDVWRAHMLSDFVQDFFRMTERDSIQLKIYQLDQIA